ncbi:uncharacterized protein LOC127281110 [Leptopilina boulardi]|uniref:uncharacterized protein LOC127281110 n=1 Tax=Leptopilina boulardi TaxID=63433 RepID=UPI0021F587ED|nr:uncharacterized protein LOC127281110 [Leptopilina boulardi]
MEESKYFPNQCIICQSTMKLRKCTGCNMVQYCDKSHQLQHWPQHKSFCKAIGKILERKKITHIYEKLANKSFDTWLSEIILITEDITKHLKRIPNSIETNILKYPRVCFICREAKQEKLKNCPNCPFASFCEQHPNSEIHNRNCLILKNRYDDIKCKLTLSLTFSLDDIVKEFAMGTKISKINDESLTTLKQFFDNYTKPVREIPEIEKIIVSEFFSVSLTIFQTLQMIYYENFPTEIIIHLDISGGPDEFIICDNYWEILLHLLPDIKSLKIIICEAKLTYANKSSLCNDCKLKKKKIFIETQTMPYEIYLTQSNYQQPSLISYFNVRPLKNENIVKKYWQKIIEKFGKINCPIVFLTFNEEILRVIKKDVLNSPIKFNIIYSGFNNFAPLTYLELNVDGTLFRTSQFLIILQQRINGKNNSKSIITKGNRPRTYFYHQICHVCHKYQAKITCNRCRIISYCGNKHRNQDQIQHKDICRAILILLNEMSTVNLFENVKTTDSDLWLRAKIDIMKKVKAKLGREMEEFEEQMFLFPKACAICHDSDLSLLKICDCGAFLCKIHNKDEKHKKLCKILSFAYAICTKENDSNSTLEINSAKGLYEKLPSSMIGFLNSNFVISRKYENKMDINCHQRLMTSNLITSSLTLRYFINKFDSFLTMQTMVIHIIGVKEKDFIEENSWKIFLYSMKELKDLKIIFIGPQVPNCPETIIVETSDFHAIGVKRLKIEYRSITYDKYFTSKKFIKPQIILGCNLNIHESKLFEISKNTWKETILTVEKVGVPFILTSGTKERAEMEHKIICDLLGKSVNFQFFQENPFASLCPERDFETEGVMYANKFVIAYVWKYKNSSNLLQENEIKINEINENSQLATNITTQENNSEAKEIIVKDTEAEKIKVFCENLEKDENIEKTDLFLLKCNKFLIGENEKLKEQLNAANVQIKEQKNMILELKKIYSNFVENNRILELEKIYNDFVKKFNENIN